MVVVAHVVVVVVAAAAAAAPQLGPSMEYDDGPYSSGVCKEVLIG